MYKRISICIISVLAFHATYYCQTPGATVNPTPSWPTTIEWPEQTLCESFNGAMGTPDLDGDGIDNCVDNCVFDPNKNQKDKNKDGVGDACEWRKRAKDEWRRNGQQQFRTATEPVDLSRLAKTSSVIVLATVGRGFSLEKPGSLGGWGRINIIRQFKGKPLPEYPTRDGGVWVHFPDPDRGGAMEFAGEVLFFLNNGKLKKWSEPQVYHGDFQNGIPPYTETHYFGYQLTNLKYGILGVSPERLRQLEEIVKAPKRAP